MGTRADFYIGKGKDAEWIGSIAFDGYRIDQIKQPPLEPHRYAADVGACWKIKNATSENDFRAAVAELLAINEDATTPDQGWPWPWNDSHTTDYAYAFVDGHCRTFPWGKGSAWPDMSARKNVTLGKRSGMIVLGG